MPAPPNYTCAFLRVFFVVMLITILLLPGLSASVPKPYFAALQSTIGQIPLASYALVALIAGSLLFILSGTRRVAYRLKQNISTSGKVEDNFWVLPIEEAVSTKNGGNGLATRPFTLLTSLFTWVIVSTPHMECVVLDGRHIIRQTRLCFSPAHLFGKPTRARRVLLSPQPQVMPPIQALSRDHLNVQIRATVTYRLVDPRRALAQAPLEEFTQLVQGILTEHIHAYEQIELLGDRGNLRIVLEDKLRKQRSLRGFEIIEIPIASIDGDMRLIEIEQETRFATARSGLLAREGENRLREERYTREIEQLRLQLVDWAANRAHDRDMARLFAELGAKNFGVVIESAAASA